MQHETPLSTVRTRFELQNITQIIWAIFLAVSMAMECYDHDFQNFDDCCTFPWTFLCLGPEKAFRLLKLYKFLSDCPRCSRECSQEWTPDNRPKLDGKKMTLDAVHRDSIELIQPSIAQPDLSKCFWSHFPPCSTSGQAGGSDWYQLLIGNSDVHIEAFWICDSVYRERHGCCQEVL